MRAQHGEESSSYALEGSRCQPSRFALVRVYEKRCEKCAAHVLNSMQRDLLQSPWYFFAQ